MGRIWQIACFLVLALPAFAAGGSCPTLSGGQTVTIQGVPYTSFSAAGVTSCYFVSKSTGSDSNAGTSEAAPWAHLPDMPSCSGTCSSTSISAGTGFILRGGEVWAASDLGITWTHNGTASHPNYIGVDPTWYNSTNCGSSWCRPVFNPAGSAMTGSLYFFLNNGSTTIYTTVDNIEETGWSCAAMESGTMNGTISPDGEYENLYIHGWSYNTGDSSCQVFAFGANISDGSSQIAGTNVHNNYVDGSDQSPSAASTGLIPVGCVLHGYIFANNVCRYVYNINGEFYQLTGNWVDHVYAGNSGDHCNMMNFAGISSGSTGIAANNVFSNMECSGGVILWLSGNSASSSAVYLASGNVFYNTDTGAGPITVCTHPSQGIDCGLFLIWNNTAATNQTFAGNGQCSTPVSSFTGSSGTLTFTTGNQVSCGGSNNGADYAAGQIILLTGFSGANTGLNGQYVTVLSGGLSATSFEATVTGSGYSSGSGTADGQIRGQMYFANNHLIGSASLCITTGLFCFDEGNELIQSAAVADANITPHFDQYSSSQSPYVYAPVASTNSTVGAGQDVNSNINNWCSANDPLGFSCPSISFTGALAFALSDTTYATEDTSNHTVVMRTVNTRGSLWDIGAYQFASAVDYTLTTTVTGTGSVSSSPSGISCPSTCSASYSSGTVVTLTETPGGGYTFSGWSGGGCSGTATTCAVTMSTAQSVTASFTGGTTYLLSVTVQGSGAIISSPPGLNCLGACSANFNSGTVVTLTAVPGTGQIVDAWADGCSGTGNTCSVTMNAAETATVVFSGNAPTTSQLANNLTATSTNFSISNGIVTSAATNSFGSYAWLGISGCTTATQLNGQLIFTNGSTTTSSVVGNLYNTQLTVLSPSNVGTTADTGCYFQGQGWQPFVIAPFPAPGSTNCTLGNGSPSCALAPANAGPGSNTWAFDASIGGGNYGRPVVPIVQMADPSYTSTHASLVPSLAGESYEQNISLPDSQNPPHYMHALVNEGRLDIYAGHIDNTHCAGMPCYVTDVTSDANAWTQNPNDLGAFSRNPANDPGPNEQLRYVLLLTNNYAPVLESFTLKYASGAVTASSGPNVLYQVNTCPDWGHTTIGTGLATVEGMRVDNFDNAVTFALGSGSQGGPGRHMVFTVFLSTGKCQTWNTEGTVGSGVTTYQVTSSHGGTGYTNGATMTGVCGDTYTLTASGGVVSALTQTAIGSNCPLSKANSTTGGGGTGLEYDITSVGVAGSTETIFAPIASASCPAGTTLTCEGAIATTLYPFGIHGGGQLDNGQYAYVSGWGTSGDPTRCGSCDYVAETLGSSPALTGSTSGNQNGHPALGFNFMGTASNPTYYQNLLISAYADPSCGNSLDCYLQFQLASSCSSAPGGVQMHSGQGSMGNVDTSPTWVTSSINTPATPTQTNPLGTTCGLGQNSLFTINRVAGGATNWLAHHYENTNNYKSGSPPLENFEGADTICAFAPDNRFALCAQDQNANFAGNTGLGLDDSSAAYVGTLSFTPPQNGVTVVPAPPLGMFAFTGESDSQEGVTTSITVR